MSEDLIRYDIVIQDALRGAVRKILEEVLRTGLPGEHHFYIAFDTTAPGVRISPRIRERYPQEMTVVMQHQFWDLVVGEHTFEVGLSFNGIPERLVIPFSAIKGFFDPSVQFALEFEPGKTAEELPEEIRAAGDAAQTLERVAELTERDDEAKTVTPLALAKTSVADEDTAEPVRPAKDASAEAAGGKSDDKSEKSGDKDGADVVSLDAFRKKS
ncbi:ClpXP protease specificity-enhancing factor SspB [Breoghania sp. L-A4]|uniref:SspB family protein n=1 Tax=Breoghania sp. L-A4 TaxID=2304600 RepID=UPI000E35A405|nr:ClpXP protease specificity-enhancing factor SspB [Breoghania sp. L-A4]AXS41306.1 hypothetical protein D1F64_16350 [Breoghania sp. L-A4]